MNKLIECVPNFSEGRDMDVIKRITDAIEAVDGVLKIVRIKVHYFLKVEPEKQRDVRQAMDEYLVKCPGAQSVIGCIDLTDEMTMEVP